MTRRTIIPVLAWATILVGAVMAVAIIAIGLLVILGQTK